MQRFLTRPSALVVLLLAGCWHEAFHTSIENETGQKIYLTIHFDDEGPPGRGYVEPGNGVNLPQKLETIGYIEYQIDGRTCRLEKRSITESARVDGRGVSQIPLRDCGESGS